MFYFLGEKVVNTSLNILTVNSHIVLLETAKHHNND